MIWFGWIGVFLGFAYLVLILKMVQIWKNTPELSIPDQYTPSLKISILIAARNEEANILPLLQSIQRQKYPPSLFEVILIDDYSEDKTVEFASALDWDQLRILKLEDLLAERPQNSFKKKAIETGIENAKFPIILTTDADCIAPPNWLSTMAYAFESKSAKIITGPVAFHKAKNLLGQFQILEFAGTMLVTLAGIESKKMYSGNGANLMYSKTTFESVNGFQGNENHASGDDLFLIHKIAEKSPEGIAFVKNKQAQIFTEPKHKIAGLWQQRIRWGTKSSSYKDFNILLLFSLVFLTALSLVLSGIWTLLNLKFLPFFIAIISFKIIADFLLLHTASKGLGLAASMHYFIPSFFIYSCYILAVGIGSLFLKNYEWKGRRVQ